VDEADETLGFDLGRLMAEGPPEVLDDTVNAQPALLAASIAIARAAADDLPNPAFVAGHSMGEYSALVASGALSYADALRLVRERGRLMKLAGKMRPGCMAAVLGMADGDVVAACDAIEGAEVANYNAPGQVVISGTVEGVGAASEVLRAAGAKRVIPLAVSIAAHSQLMGPVAGEFARAVGAVSLAPPSVPVVLNRTGKPTTAPDEIRHALAQQLTRPVLWTASVLQMCDDGVDAFFEIGSGSVLSGLVRRIVRGLDGMHPEIVSLAEPPSGRASL
jgi:[acyl-carrier-protein] S-malonyltransferase